ncbi:LLM class flavin-dependent oxidoreductase [Amycolatopsis pithecellobii]|nr:LLM class flavin-dependent oxidoreductase [Amycolatopsis pithecellobii]
MSVQIGIASLSDIQPTTVDGRQRSVEERTKQIVELGVLADAVGLDTFGLGEHHSFDFAVSSPAVVLAAIAGRTRSIRLSSAVSTLGALDPVRLYQDFASLNLVSSGRAELIVGRSAYPEPFALFGEPIESYDALFAEKLDLLLTIRDNPVVTWQGRFRSPLVGAEVPPRTRNELPIWLGAGGTPASIVRAGRLGLPVVLGYIGGDAGRLAQLVDLYRQAGAAANVSDRLSVGVALHYLAVTDPSDVDASYPFYRDFLRPKKPGGGGFIVEPEQFRRGLEPDGHLMIGAPEQILDKLTRLHKLLGLDRIQALVDWGGLPGEQVDRSVRALGEFIAPELRGLG